MRRRQLTSCLLLLALTALAACQERLAAPAECPELCPGRYDVRDTVLTPDFGSDSAFEGYVQPGSGNSLRVSWQFATSEDRAFVRFVARPDSFQVGDSLYPYSIDSVRVSVTLLARDTLVPGLTLYLYRLPATVDSTVSFTTLDTAFTPANLVDSIPVPDTTYAQAFSALLTGAALSRVAIPAADSGVLALGVQIRASRGTGVRIGGVAGGTAAPAFQTYVQVMQPDTTFPRTLTRSVQAARWVSETPPVLDPDLLTVGGGPSARSLLRFPWPVYLRDSVQLVRASLELLPAVPLPGLPGDTAFLHVRPLLADLGDKSPASTDALFTSTLPVFAGDSDTIRIEVWRGLALWQGTQPLPSAFVLQILPEAASFTRATFGSSRTPGFEPRLRVTYVRKYPFEAP